MKHTIFAILAIVVLLTSMSVSAEGSDNRIIGINVLLNTEITKDILAELGTYGTVCGVIGEIKAVMLLAKQGVLDSIKALPYVESANPDAYRYAGPVKTLPVEDLANGLSTWNMDAINVTELGFDNRQVDFDGTGVCVAVLDTGLVKNWRQYFPEERIAAEYGKSFGGGGAERGHVSEQPNKWELDTESHGTLVTSTIIGYSLFGIPINGVAPKARVIPVKVLNNAGRGWSSVIAQGITYIAGLKANELADYPIVINMSLGGPVQDPLEKAAIDYAISQGVIIVASAGNEGDAGMGYPAAYAPVISVAASGWIGEWLPAGNADWWYNSNVADPTNSDDFYIVPWSSRELSGQDLDVAAPGTWIVGPYQYQMGKISYSFNSGTSLSSPQVAGIVALMAQKYPSLTALQAESILESSAIPLSPDCRIVLTPWGWEAPCWGVDATGAGLATADAALAATP